MEPNRHREYSVMILSAASLDQTPHIRGDWISATVGPSDTEVPATANAPRPALQTFDFDWLGNLRSSTDDFGDFYDRSLGVVASGAGSTGPNQLVSAGSGRIAAHHDEAGNLVDLILERQECVQTGGLCTHRFVYDWDEVGQLERARRWDYKQLLGSEPVFPAIPSSTTAADIRFRYDARGERVLRSSVSATGQHRHDAWPLPTLRLYNANFDGVSRRYERTASTEEVQLLGIGRVVYEPAAPGPAVHILFELRDHLGSTTSVIDRNTSELVERRSYYVLGGRESEYSPPRWAGLTARSSFSGKEADGQVGLIYFGARYYHPALGRWVSPDPLAIHRVGSDLNPYGYVSGDSINAVDPKGLQACIGAELCDGSGDGNAPLLDFGPGGGGSLLRLFTGLFGGGSKSVYRPPAPGAAAVAERPRSIQGRI